MYNDIKVFCRYKKGNKEFEKCSTIAEVKLWKFKQNLKLS